MVKHQWFNFFIKIHITEQKFDWNNFLMTIKSFFSVAHMWTHLVVIQLYVLIYIVSIDRVDYFNKTTREIMSTGLWKGHFDSRKSLTRDVMNYGNPRIMVFFRTQWKLETLHEWLRCEFAWQRGQLVVGYLKWILKTLDFMKY